MSQGGEKAMRAIDKRGVAGKGFLFERMLGEEAGELPWLALRETLRHSWRRSDALMHAIYAKPGIASCARA